MAVLVTPGAISSFDVRFIFIGLCEMSNVNPRVGFVTVSSPHTIHYHGISWGFFLRDAGKEAPTDTLTQNPFDLFAS